MEVHARSWNLVKPEVPHTELPEKRYLKVLTGPGSCVGHAAMSAKVTGTQNTPNRQKTVQKTTENDKTYFCHILASILALVARVCAALLAALC